MDTRNGKEDMPTEKHKNYHRRGYQEQFHASKFGNVDCVNKFVEKNVNDKIFFGKKLKQ